MKIILNKQDIISALIPYKTSLEYRCNLETLTQSEIDRIAHYYYNKFNNSDIRGEYVDKPISYKYNFKKDKLKIKL